MRQRKLREHRNGEDCYLQPGITKNATVVLAKGRMIRVLSPSRIMRPFAATAAPPQRLRSFSNAVNMSIKV